MDNLEGSAKASPTLVPLATKEELLAWAEKIKPHVPHCITMYNSLTLHGGGYFSHGMFYVLQDQPATHVVVYWGTFQPTKQHIALFCLEEEVDELTEALRTAPFVNWGDTLVLHHIPPYLLGILQRLTEERSTNMILIPCITYTYQPHLDTQPLRVGPGLRVCQLGKAGIHRLLENSKYGEMPLLEMMSSLAQQVPFVGVYRDSGVTQDITVDLNSLPMAEDEEVPVAWVCTSFLGDVARLMTDKGYRRHGLGSLITTAVARQQATLLEIIPHAFVEASNAASHAMFTGLAGWKLTHEAFWLCNDMS